MNQTVQYLKQIRANIGGLENISNNCDPASGVSFAVRRGAARDNEDVSDDDEKRRPWITAEIDDETAKSVIKALIVSLKRSESFSIINLKAEITEAQNYLKEIQK